MTWSAASRPLSRLFARASWLRLLRWAPPRSALVLLLLLQAVAGSALVLLVLLQAVAAQRRAAEARMVGQP